MVTTKGKSSEPKKTVEIFNLEFPAYISELKIGDYLFKRVKNYRITSDRMMWLVDSGGSEFGRQTKTGSHQITATVDIPAQEKPCVLLWENKKFTQLDDILLLLTIFTGRNVFKKDWDTSEQVAISSDHREHHFGGQLHLSLKREWVYKNIRTGELKTALRVNEQTSFDHRQVNVGFEKSLNQVLETISSKKWQDEYEGGYFLFLYRSAIQRQIIETSFILCWTIWEHIFAIKNRKWLDNETIERMSGDKKIGFILSEYFAKNIDNIVRSELQKINKTRNRLIHFGQVPVGVDNDVMDMFIRLTEQLMAIVLGLSPSNTLNSREKLEHFLRGSQK